MYTGEEKKTEEDTAADSDAAMKMKRAELPNNDYGQASASVYGTWTWLFPLGRGLDDGKSIATSTMRHLMLYHDNRFAHDPSLLFHCANTTMRHLVNSSVGARVKSNPEVYRHVQRRVYGDVCGHVYRCVYRYACV